MRLKLEIVSPTITNHITIFSFDTLTIAQIHRSCWVNLGEGRYRVHCAKGLLRVRGEGFDESARHLYFEIVGGVVRLADRRQPQALLHRLYARYDACRNLFWSSYWANLHWLSACYPQNPTNADCHEMGVLIFTLTQEGAIPCPICQEHYRNYVAQKNVLECTREFFANRDACLQFFVDLHNDVNKRNGKRVYTLDEARQLYKTERLPKFCEPIVEMFKQRRLADFPKYFVGKTLNDILASNNLGIHKENLAQNS